MIEHCDERDRNLTIACDAAGRNASYKVIYLHNSLINVSIMIPTCGERNIQQRETLRCPCLKLESVEFIRSRDANFLN